MKRIADTFGEKIGMSRRDIHRMARELAIADLDRLARENSEILPLLANKNNLWPKVEWPREPGEPFTEQRRLALRALFFLLLVRAALPAAWTNPPKNAGEDGPQSYIRKVLQTREAALEAVKTSVLPFGQFLNSTLPAIWPGAGDGASEPRVAEAIADKLKGLDRLVWNAFVAGYPEWQSRVIFQKETYLEFADRANGTGVRYQRGRDWRIFNTREEFQRFIDKPERESPLLRPKSPPPKRPLLENITRNGPPQYFTGTDADAFMHRFAFRGGEFGNWLSQDDRQANLEWASSALADLARILGIDGKLIGRESLGFAFGARGGGPVAAHYEPDFNVINLTKWRGAGSAAHEWAHFIDFKVLRPKGVGSNSMSWLYGYVPIGGRELVEERRKNLAREENRILIRLHFADVKSALEAERRLASFSSWQDYREYFLQLVAPVLDEASLKKYEDYLRTGIEPMILGRESEFHANAKLLDRGWRKYWATPHELFARAFEKFVLDRLAAAGWHNDYLVTLYEHEIPPSPNEEEMGVFAPKLEEIIRRHIAEKS